MFTKYERAVCVFPSWLLTSLPLPWQGPGRDYYLLKASSTGGLWFAGDFLGCFSIYFVLFCFVSSSDPRWLHGCTEDMPFPSYVCKTWEWPMSLDRILNRREQSMKETSALSYKIPNLPHTAIMAIFFVLLIIIQFGKPRS